jgi:hypothetical protein
MSSLFANDLPRASIGTEPDKSGMPKVAVRSPLNELELSHQLWL